MTALRPLGVGEMLDRAVTIYVRSFDRIARVTLAIAVPSSASYWLGGRSVLGFVWLSAFHRLAVSARELPWSVRPISQVVHPITTIAKIAIDFFFAPFCVASFVSIVVAGYAERPMSIRTASRRSTRHWLAIAAIVAIFEALKVVAFAVAFAVGVALAMWVTKHIDAGASVVWLAYDIVVAEAIVAIPAIAFVFLIRDVAYCACVCEGLAPLRALRYAYTHVLLRHDLRRKTVCALGYGTLTVALNAVGFTGLRFVATFTSNVLPRVLLGSSIALVAALVSTFAFVFYVDLRFRDDGSDVRGRSFVRDAAEVT